MKKKSKLLAAIITAILIFTVGILLAVVECQELGLFMNHFEDSVPREVFVSKQNKHVQLILNFFMLAIGGSLLSFSIIFRGFYFKNRLYDKLSAIISLIVVFIVNIFVEFDGIFAIFTGLTIIITFDCIFIFLKEAYDSIMEKKKA